LKKLSVTAHQNTLANAPIDAQIGCVNNAQFLSISRESIWDTDTSIYPKNTNLFCKPSFVPPLI